MDIAINFLIAGSFMCAMYLLFFRPEVFKFQDIISKRIAHRRKVKVLEKKKILILQSEDPEEIELFITQNIKHIDSKLFQECADRIQFLRAREIVAMDGGVWRVEDIKPKVRITENELTEEEFEDRCQEPLTERSFPKDRKYNGF